MQELSLIGFLFLVIASSAIVGIAYGQNGIFDVRDFGATGNGLDDDSRVNFLNPLSSFLALLNHICQEFYTYCVHFSILFSYILYSREIYIYMS